MNLLQSSLPVALPVALGAKGNVDISQGCQLGPETQGGAGLLAITSAPPGLAAPVLTVALRWIGRKRQVLPAVAHAKSW